MNNSTNIKSNNKNLVENIFKRVFIVIFSFVVLYFSFINFSFAENYFYFSCHSKNVKELLDSSVLGLASDSLSVLEECKSKVNFDGYGYCGQNNSFINSSGDGFTYNTGGTAASYLCYQRENQGGYFQGVWVTWSPASGSDLDKKYCEQTKKGTWDEQTKICKEKQKECENGSIYDINLGKCRSDCESNNLTYDDAYSNWGGCVSDKCLAKQYKLPEDYGEKPPLDSAYAGYLDKDNCFAECVPDVNICPSGNCNQTITCSYTGTAGLPTNWSDEDKKKVYVSSVGGNGETTSTGDNQGGNNNPESDKEGTDKDKTDGDKPGTSSGSDGDKEGGSNTGSTTGSETGSQTGSEGGSQTGTEGGTGSGSGDGDSDGKNDGDGEGDGNGDEVVDGDFDGDFGDPEKTDIPEASFDIFELFEKYRKDYFKFSRSCPTSVQIDIFGQIKTINIDILCKFGDFLRLILHISAYMILLKLVSSVLTQKT